MSDLFDEKNISPMLLYETEPFDDADYIYELKLDGIRCRQAHARLGQDKGHAGRGTTSMQLPKRRKRRNSTNRCSKFHRGNGEF